MDIEVPDLPASTIRQPRAAYPTIAESWAVLGWYLLAGLGVGTPAYLLGEKVVRLPLTHTLVLTTVLTNLAVVGLLRWRAGNRWQPVQFGGREQPWLYASLPLLVLAAITLLSTVELLHLPNWADSTFQKMMNTPVAAFVLLVVAAPVLEEILFRGVVLQGLLRGQRPWVAIGQSALIFGLFHFNPAQSLNAALLGLLLGWLYYRTRSLWVCMVVHALNNYAAFVGMLLIPAAWQNQTMVSMVGTGRYAVAVVVSAGVLLGLLWWLRQITRPAMPQ